MKQNKLLKLSALTLFITFFIFVPNFYAIDFIDKIGTMTGDVKDSLKDNIVETFAVFALVICGILYPFWNAARGFLVKIAIGAGIALLAPTAYNFLKGALVIYEKNRAVIERILQT